MGDFVRRAASRVRMYMWNYYARLLPAGPGPGDTPRPDKRRVVVSIIIVAINAARLAQARARGPLEMPCRAGV